MTPLRGGVELKAVTKRFGSVGAVSEVSLTVEQGEFLTLLGPSGCGKTTILRMIGGLESPTSGSIFIGATDVTDRPPYLRDCAIVFQQYALFPHKTVFDNIAFGLKYHGVPKDERGDRVREALRLVRLPDVEDRYPRQLSGGQQQRIALARALVVNPAVLLLDEPLSNLDRKLREEMREELKELHERLRMSFIFVTHDQLEAISMSDRVVLMERGRIAQIGTPPEIYETPRSRFVAEFMGKSNFIDCKVRQVNGGGAISVVSPLGLEIHATARHQVSVGQEVVVRIRAEQVDILEASQGNGSTATHAAQVERVTYCGEAVEYYLRLQSGERLLSLSPLSSHRELRRKGAAVNVRLRPEDCFVVSDQR